MLALFPLQGEGRQGTGDGGRGMGDGGTGGGGSSKDDSKQIRPILI